MRTSLLLCVIQLVSAQFTAHHHRQAESQPWKMRHLLHAEPVASVRLSPLPGPEAAPGHHVGVRRLLHEVEDESHADLHAPFGRRLSLNFEAFGKKHSVDLNLHDALFEEGSMSRYTDDQGAEVVEIPHAVAYTGTFLDGGWIRATIYDDDVIRAMWLDKSRGVVNMLTPVSYYEAMAPSVAASARAAGAKMLAFPLHDMDHSDDDRRLLESWLGIPMSSHLNFQQQMPSVLRNSLMNTSAPYGLMSGCPSTMQRVALGFAMDTGYTKGISGLGTTAITSLAAVRRVNTDIQFQFNIMNVLYVDMANVFLTLAETVVKTKVGGESWNEEPLNPSILTGVESNRRANGCLVSRTVPTIVDDYGRTLTNFGSWRAALPVTRRHAAWQLMTACFPGPGTIGLAYLGATCRTDNVGVGWTTLQDESTLLTVAHEVGHNFNAAHTFGDGGLMSYDGTRIKEFKFRGSNPSQICSHINAVQGVCYGVMSPRCGNGVIEAGEDCDDATVCCNRTTCRLAIGAQCTPGISPDCCTAGCNFRPTYVGCAAPGDTGLGYCVNGHCKVNIRGTLMAGGACNATETTPCREHGRSTVGGACQSNDATYIMPNGALCNAALDKECLNGVCVTPTAPLEVPPVNNVRRALQNQDMRLDVDNPREGEILYVGTLALIQWTVVLDSVSDSVAVTLTLSDGTMILERGQMQGQYVWNVQAAPGADHTVTIRAQNSTHATTGVSGVFAIQEKPAVVLTLPAEDAVVRQGEATTIAWTNVGAAALSEIFLSIQDVESHLETSLGSTPNTGEFAWVPSSTLSAGLFRILVEYSPPTRPGNVTLRGPVFQLQPSRSEDTIAFLSPSGDTFLEVGKTHRIVWTSPASLVNATLYLVQPWSNFSKLLMEGVDENVFDWKVDHLGAGFQLEVYDATADGQHVMNATSQPFSISAPQPFVSITSIFDGQDGALWVRGRNATVLVEASDPSDTLTLEIRDQQGLLIHVVMTDAPASGLIQIPIPFAVPPPDFSACFLVASSNKYPGVAHTFPTPFSIFSQGHNDLPSVPSSLQLKEPVDNAALIPGSNVNITWEGIMVSSVTLILSNKTSGETTPLATVENLGFFEWTVPLTLGEYTLSLVGDGIMTPPILVSIASDLSKTPSLAVAADMPPIISEGDSVNVLYTSSGVVLPVTIELWTNLGFIATITDNAPTNGSYQFEVVASHFSKIDDAFFVLSTSSGARAQSSSFSLYPQQSLSNMSVGATTLYKGVSYNVTWNSTGLPFPVAILLYRGIPDQRSTVSGHKCLEWKDRGITHQGCVLSYDLNSEMCATEVGDNGRWLVGGRCKPLSETYPLISVMETALSTDNRAQIEFPAAETDLPFPSTDYSIVVAATTSLKMEARSAIFGIQNPLIEIVFPIVVQGYGKPLAEIQASVLNILTTVLDIEPSRLLVDLSGSGVHDLVRVRIQPTNSLLENAAFEAAQLFVTQWSDPTSPLIKAVNNTTLFSLDTAGGHPLISFMAETDSSHVRRVKKSGVVAASIILGLVATLFLVVYTIRRRF